MNIGCGVFTFLLCADFGMENELIALLEFPTEYSSHRTHEKEFSSDYVK